MNGVPVRRRVGYIRRYHTGQLIGELRRGPWPLTNRNTPLLIGLVFPCAILARTPNLNLRLSVSSFWPVSLFLPDLEGVDHRTVSRRRGPETKGRLLRSGLVGEGPLEHLRFDYPCTFFTQNTTEIPGATTGRKIRWFESRLKITMTVARRVVQAERASSNMVVCQGIRWACFLST